MGNYYVPPTTRTQIAVKASGVISEPWPASVNSGSNAPVDGETYGVLVGLKAGDVCTGVLLRIGTAASGTDATRARVGLADATGKILVLSGDLKAASNWPAGAAPMPFTVPYTILADGAYIPCFITVGIWGTTQPQPLFGNINVNNATFGSNTPITVRMGGNTDLPAIGASLTLTTSSNKNFYQAIY